MEHFKQIESFMDLYDFDQPILSNTESDPFGGNQLQRQFSECAGGSCGVEHYRSGSNVLSNINDPSFRQFGAPGANGGGNVGTGGTAGIRQDIGHAIAPGFGRGNGYQYSRGMSRTFNRDFQRTSSGSQYAQGLPASYYPSTYGIGVVGNAMTGYSTTTYPYQANMDPFPDGPTVPSSYVQNQGQQLAGPMRDQYYNQVKGGYQEPPPPALPIAQDPLSIVQKLSQQLPQSPEVLRDLQELQQQLLYSQQAQLPLQPQTNPTEMLIPFVIALIIFAMLWFYGGDIFRHF